MLDDADRLDAGSRQVLARLAGDLPALPMLVLRAELPGEPVPGALEVSCRPLDRAAVAELVAGRLPGATVRPDLVEHVADRTDGSPLAVVAYLLRLLDAGLLTPMWGTWQLDAAGAALLPPVEGVRELLAARLARMPAEAFPHLLAAAVAGERFRTETLIAATSSADDAVAAVAAAVDRRVIEARPGGWYAFIHPLLREALLDGVPEDRIRELHAALARALDVLPEALRDTDHIYAVARHYQRAGDALPADQRRRTALTAGRRALDDQAPRDAAAFLLQAIDDDPAPGTAVLHSLAVAQLRCARFAEAAELIDRALAGTTDRRQRAALLTTQIELRHTQWDDEAALQSTSRALTELRRALPRNPVLLLVSTFSIALAGGLVRRTGLGSGTVRGRRREELAALVAVLDTGAYAAGTGMRLREVGVFAMRALYAVNRLGPSPEYARVYALIGYITALLKLRGVAGRCLDRAAQVADRLGDPALYGYIEWIRGVAWLFGGHDDGTAMETAIAKYERWFGPAQLIPSHSTMGTRLLLRGYTAKAAVEYERGLGGLLDPRLLAGSSLSMLGVMIPAVEGRHAEAAKALAELRAAVPDGSNTQRAHILTAAICAAVEQGEIGEPFEQLIAEFHALGLKPRELMTQMKWFYAFQSYGRMAQLRLATDEQRPAATVAAREAVRDLRRVRKASPLLRAAYLIGEAAFAQLTGDHQAAIGWADKAEPIARRTDAPVLHFEVARVRARAFRALGQANEADRQARVALLLATHYGWDQRRRQVRAELGVEDGGGTNVDRRSDAGRSRRLEALQQVGAAAATVLDPQELARVALDEMLRILGAERALFFLLDDAGEPVQFAGRGADGTDLEETTAYGATLVRRVAESGEALVLTGTEQGAALGSRSVVVHGLRSILVAPVQFKGTTMGVVYLDSRLARGIFTGDDVDVLTAVAGHVAVSLETARAAQLHLAVQAAQQQQAFAEMLRESLAELSAIHDPAALVRTLFGTLVLHSGAVAGCLLSDSPGPEGGRWVLEVAGSAPPDALGRHLDAGLGDLSGPAELAEVLGGAPAVLAVPLSHGAGIVLLGAAAFDESTRQVSTALAIQGMSAYENACLFSRVRELATTDELTGQHNRRHFYAIAGAVVQAAGRTGRELAGAMIDIDNFKNINDTYGHGAGDEVIRTVAARVRAAIRQSDVLGRYGGEEFAVVLPDHEGDAPVLAERMRAAVAAEPVATTAGPVAVTISVGLTALAPGDAGLDQLLARADRALYRAKESGRNQVQVVAA